MAYSILPNFGLRETLLLYPFCGNNRMRILVAVAFNEPVLVVWH